nr:glycosyltransferase 87 family protein [Streptomyces cavernae]
MLWLVTHDESRWLGGGGVAREVHHLYQRWSEVLLHGGFPVGDQLWQYPPGAGAVLLLPALLPGPTYFQGFVLLALAADAVVALAVLGAGMRKGRSALGALFWVAGLPLLLHLPMARYDLPATALAVLSLLTLTRSTRACGAFAAVGALVKVWPALVLLGTPKGRSSKEIWTSAAVTATALLALLTAFFTHPFDFLRQQSGRGVQIESLGGTALALASRAGWPGKARHQYGAMEFTGPYVRQVAMVSMVLTVAAFGLLVLWRLRARRWTEATPYDAALAAVLLFTVTSRVISPQYMIWLVGLAAVCLTSRHTTQRPVAALLMAATALSTVAYPAFYGEVIRCTWAGCLLMVVRNGLLAAAAALSFVRLWRAAGAPRTVAPRTVERPSEGET